MLNVESWRGSAGILSRGSCSYEATKAVPPLPGLSSLPGGRPGYDDVEEAAVGRQRKKGTHAASKAAQVYSDDSISEDIQMSSRSM